MPPGNAAEWILGALVGVLGLIVAGTLMWLMGQRWRKRLTKLAGAAGVPRDFRRGVQSWLGRLGHFGFQMRSPLRLENVGDADAYRWVLVHEGERSFATLDRLVRLRDGRAKVELTFYTALADGTLVVTQDRPVCDPVPRYWSPAGRRFRTVEGQWKEHLKRMEATGGRVLPDPEQLPDLLAADEAACHATLLAAGDHVATIQGPNVIRLKVDRVFRRLLPALRDLFLLKYLPSGRRWDVAAVADVEEEEKESAGGPLGLALEQAVEQDLQRYKRASQARATPVDHLRRAVVLLTLVGLMVAVFGREKPLQTAAIVLVLVALHEFGHWLPMRLFGYRGTARFFVPFSGAAEGGRKLQAPAWQQLVVLFGGPLPGLVAGLAVLAKAHFTPEMPGWLVDAAGLSVVLNGFHLIPMLPLDGGKIVDVLLFRDLPYFRPLFTFCSAGLALVGALALKSRVLKFFAGGMFGALVWDIQTLGIVRGARKLEWAGDVTDENEALRRIFRGVREEGNAGFVGSENWVRKIDVLLEEVMRQRPRLFVRVAGSGFYALTCAVPLAAVGVLMAIPLMRMPVALLDGPDQSIEFRGVFPEEDREVKDPVAVSALRELTRRAAAGFGNFPDLDEPGSMGEVAARVLPVIELRLGQLDWEDAGIERRRGNLDAKMLGLWLEAQALRMENAAANGEHQAALLRAEVLLHAIAKLEPAPNFRDRRYLWDAELRALQVIERENAGGRFDPQTLRRLDARLTQLNRAPVPEVDNFLLVNEWAVRERARALEFANRAGGFDVRFWRDLYPRTQRFKELLRAADEPITPASVAVARLWKKSRRVGELPPRLPEMVSVAEGEAELIQDFCEGHRLISWRRLTTISALRLEAHRKKSGSFPSHYKHSVPGGASLELVHRGGPLLRLVDQRSELERMIPPWLVSADGRDLPALPRVHHDCPLYGAPEAPSLSAK